MDKTKSIKKCVNLNSATHRIMSLSKYVMFRCFPIIQNTRPLSIQLHSWDKVLKRLPIEIPDFFPFRLKSVAMTRCQCTNPGIQHSSNVQYSHQYLISHEIIFLLRMFQFSVSSIPGWFQIFFLISAVFEDYTRQCIWQLYLQLVLTSCIWRFICNVPPGRH